MTDGEKADILRALSEIVTDLMPDAVLVEKYGGLMIERVAGDPKSQCGGIFAYTAHVSLEFSQGAAMADPHGALEGNGKHRRHIKLHTPADVEAKHCRAYLAHLGGA